MGFRPDDWLLEELTKQGETGYPLVSPDSASALLNWARSARERRPIVLVGAGMSLNAHPVPRWQELEPTRSRNNPPQALVWSALAARLREDLKHDGEGAESDALWLAELYKQRFGPEALLRQIEQAVPDRLLEPGEAHRALFEVPWQTILTTNYDTLIQRAHTKFKIASRLRVSESDLDLVRSRNREEDLELIYLHGMIERPKRIVLSLEDYRRYHLTHPGTLAKVRQLFLQHPVLLIGFSATDPNFVQWSGWLNDLVDDFRNPWVNLLVGGQPGSARRAYWKGALEFVAVTKESLHHVLRILGEFFRPTSIEAESRFIDSRITQAKSINELVEALPSWLEQLGGDPPTDLELLYRREALTKAARQAFTLTLASSGTGPSVQRRAGGLLGEVRTAFGRDWPSFLLILATQYSARTTSKYLPWNLDFLRELALLPANVPTGLVRRLKLRLLHLQVEEEGSHDVWAVAHTFLGEPYSDEEREKIEDLAQHYKLRAGLPLGEIGRGSSAQVLRRTGFVLALNGAFGAAVSQYNDAALRSRDEGEPELLEWLTIESALDMARGVSSSELSVSLADRDELERRKDWIERNFAERISWFRTLETNALNEVATGARERMWTPSGDASKVGETGSVAPSLQRWLEERWLSPWLIGRIAELNGQLQWSNRHVLEAARSMACYSSPTLEKWLKMEVDRAGRGPLAQPLLELLLQDGRWPGEWIARAESLQHVVPEFTDAQLKRLDSWITTARAKLSANLDLLRGGALTHTFVGLTPLILTQFARWNYGAARKFKEECSDWLSTIQDSPLSLRELVEQFRWLGWKFWLESGQLTPEEVDSLFRKVFDTWNEMSLQDAFTLQDIMLVVSDLLSNVGRHALPKDSQALSFVEHALDNEMLPKEFVFVTTRLRMQLAGPDVPALAAQQAALLKEELLQSRELRLQSAVFNALAEVAGGLNANQRDVMLTWLEQQPWADWQDSSFDTHWYIGVARLAIALLPLSDGKEAKRWRLLLVHCLEQSPATARYAARLPETVAGPVWRIIQDRISALLVGGLQESASNQMEALRALDAFLYAGSEPLPESWRIGAGALAHASDPVVAVSACNVLAGMVRTGRLENGATHIWNQWTFALLEAAKDGRAEVAGAAGHALVLGREVMGGRVSEEELARVDQALLHLREDKRVGVQQGLKMADWRKTRLSDSTGRPAT